MSQRRKSGGSRDLPPILVDEHQMIEVILNILTNGQQAIAPAHGGGHITIRAGRSEDSVTISISDDGPGIPPEVIKNIFDPFFTTKEVGQGTGLDLSICYGIVREHWGELRAESEPGNGATFHIQLPLIPVGEVAGVDAPEPEYAAIPAKDLLVVDDEPATLDFIARALSAEGYIVDLAGDGEEAWGKIQTKAYDCVVLDLRMKGMSGQRLYRLIEDFDKGLASRVIFMTGDTFSSDTRDFIDATPNLVLKKPFGIAELGQHLVRLPEPVHEPA